MDSRREARLTGTPALLTGLVLFAGLALSSACRAPGTPAPFASSAARGDDPRELLEATRAVVDVYGENLDRVLDSNWLARLSSDYRGARELEEYLRELMLELEAEDPHRATAGTLLVAARSLCLAADAQARRVLGAEVPPERRRAAQKILAAASAGEATPGDRAMLLDDARAWLRDERDPWAGPGVAWLLEADAALTQAMSSRSELSRAAAAVRVVERLRFYLGNVARALR